MARLAAAKIQEEQPHDRMWYRINATRALGGANKLIPTMSEELQEVSRTSPVNAKHLYNICTMSDQRRSRWADVVHMLYKCFVFAGMCLQG